MNSTLKKYFIFLILIIGLITLMELNKKKTIDWSINLSILSKSPIGLSILNKELPAILDNNEIIKYSKTPYELFEEIESIDSIKNNSFLFITYNSDLDYSESKKLLRIIEKGNTAFISSYHFNYHILDTLGVEEMNFYDGFDNSKTSVWTVNKQLPTAKFVLDKAFSQTYFYVPDSLRNKYEVLGFQYYYDKPVPNFIKIKHGKGFLFIHSQPLAFSNYALLDSNNHLYVENLLSYLPEGKLYWSVDHLDDGNFQSHSILRVILGNDSLKWAWYFLLIGLIIFIFFTAKRKQRIIPIQIPVKNTTLDFAETISNLYIQSEDYNDIIQKMITYSLEKIRRIYWLDTHKLDENFITNFQTKSNKNKEDIENWVKLVLEFQTNQNTLNEKDLITFNRATEKIFN